MDMARRRVDLRIDDDLLGRVDARAEELGQTRTKFIERALESALGDLQGTGPRDERETDPGVRDSRPAPSRASALGRLRDDLTAAAGEGECPHGRCTQRGPLGKPCPVHPNMRFKEPV